jgi:sugar lactone lactonase YvrE
MIRRAFRFQRRGKTNMRARIVLFLLSMRAVLCMSASGQNPPSAAVQEQTKEFLAALERTPRLPRDTAAFPMQAPTAGWSVDIVSSVAVDVQGVVYALQRGDKADPIIAFDKTGKVIRSWGKGMFNIPHTIRIDSAGNFWTVDAGTSLVIKFSPDGKKLMEIPIGEVPTRLNQQPGAFLGATDIAFGPNGRLYISDGYGNARILIYDSKGTRVKQWGTHGKAPGEFETPHGIAFDGKNTIYVADRGNNRIQRFDLEGHYLGEWPQVGKPYSLKFINGALWVGTQRPDQAGVTGPARRPPGWLIKVDPGTGKLVGQIEDQGAHHFIEVTKDEEMFGGSMPDGFLWFRRHN